MESQRINILLQKYFDAETTINEENELITYFNSAKVDEELKSYVPLFSELKDLAVSDNPELGDDLMNYILESEHKEKLKYRWMWQMVTGVAASVILVMLAVNFFSNQNQWKDTFTDPNQAYAEARKTLEFVAGKYNKGMAQLRPITKMENAIDPFYSGMNMLNIGFDQLDEFKTTNKKLNNE
ncbi:MAG TPA: hypothetical protein VFC65_20780 [Prolixibacteraceae bacterium]|nr:hypothetical protein [Prolixibacteraceae bacterium]